MLSGNAYKTGFHSHFEALFEHANIGILTTDISGTILAANPFALRVFGYKQQELEGEKIEILIPSRFRKTHSDYHKEFFKKPQSRLMGHGRDLLAVKKDGTEFPVEISLSYYRHEDNEFVIVIVTDITVRKQTESEIEKINNEQEATIEQRTKDLRDTLHQLETANKNLEAAVSYQRAILKNAVAMIIATDENGVIKIFNYEAAYQLGYTEEEMIDKHSPVLLIAPGDIAGKRKLLFEELGVNIEKDFDVLVEKAKRNIRTEYQYSYTRKDGSVFPVLLRINSIKNNRDVITGFLFIAMDISQRNKIEENLRMALAREKELSELKSRFVSMASHEFRTPLSTVLSSAYLLGKYTLTEEQPKREKHLQRIVSSVSMLTDILNDFLNIGKIEEGKIQIRNSNFNIRELILNFNDEIKHNLKQGQKLIYSHKGDPYVIMDPALLKHIVMNLVSNASKFSSEESPIEITTTNEPDHMRLSVKDHGIGISKEDKSHLMERFFRGENVSHIQGTGLGLHIVSKYAELMNGKVECSSELEKGTEFTISFNK